MDTVSKSNIIEYNGIGMNCSITKKENLVDLFNVSDSRTEIHKPVSTDSLSMSNDDENSPPSYERISSPFLLQKKFKNVTTVRGSYFKRSKGNATYEDEIESMMNLSDNFSNSEDSLIHIENNLKSKQEDTKIMREKVERQNKKFGEYEANEINGQVALLSYEEKHEDVEDDNNTAPADEINNMTFQELCEIIQKSPKWSPVYDNSSKPLDNRLTFELNNDSLGKDCTIKRWQIVRDSSENESIDKNEPRSTLNKSSLYSLYCPSEILNCESKFQPCETNTNIFLRNLDLSSITRSSLNDTNAAFSTIIQNENQQINCCDVSSSLSIPSSSNISPCRSTTVQNKEIQTNEIANVVRKTCEKEELKKGGKFQVNPKARPKYRSLNTSTDVRVIFKRDRDYGTINSLQNSDQVIATTTSTSIKEDLVKNSSYDVKQCLGTLCHIPQQSNSTKNTGKHSKNQMMNRQKSLREYSCRRESCLNGCDERKYLNYPVKVHHHRSQFMESEAKGSNETSLRENSSRRLCQQNNTTVPSVVKKTKTKQKADNFYDTFDGNIKERIDLFFAKYGYNRKPITESSNSRKYSHLRNHSSANYEELKSFNGDTTKKHTMQSTCRPLVSIGKYAIFDNEGKQSFIQHAKETTEQRRPQTKRYLPDNADNCKRSSRSVDDQVLSKANNKIIRNNNDTNKIISRPRLNEIKLKCQTRELPSEKICTFNNQTRTVNSTLKRSKPPDVIDTLKKIIDSTSDNNNMETNAMNILESEVSYYKTKKIGHQISNYKDTLETSQNNEQLQVSDQFISQSIGVQTASKETLRHTQTTGIQTTLDYEPFETSNDVSYNIDCKDIGASCNLTDTVNVKINNDLGNILSNTITPSSIKTDIVDDAEKYFNEQTKMTEFFDIEIDLDSENYDKIEKIITPSTAIVLDNITKTKEIVCEDKSYSDECIDQDYDVHRDSIESPHSINNTVIFYPASEKVQTTLFSDTFCTDIPEEKPTEHILNETMISAVSESKSESIPSKIFTALQLATQHACNLQKAVMIHRESLMLQDAAKKRNNEISNDFQISQFSEDQYDYADSCREYISQNTLDGKYNSLMSSDSENSINNKYDITSYRGDKTNSKISCESMSFSSTSCNSNCQLDKHECETCKAYCSTDYGRNIEEKNTLTSQNINSSLISKSIPLNDSPVLVDVKSSMKLMIYCPPEEHALKVEAVSSGNEENLKGTSRLSGKLALPKTSKIEQDFESLIFFLLPFVYGIICITVFWFFTIV